MCPFLEWDYLPNGFTFNYCTNLFLESINIEGKTIDNVNDIPIWCPLPDIKEI